MRRVGSNNPVFMMDEIDKVGAIFAATPPRRCWRCWIRSRIFTFSDHYLDVPFDLSKVMFICTANVLDTIPSALRDRMEVIQLLGYTEDEKVKIAQRYLVPRQRTCPWHKSQGDQLHDHALCVKSSAAIPAKPACATWNAKSQRLPRRGHQNR